jgi:hypothetical protein
MLSHHPWTMPALALSVRTAGAEPDRLRTIETGPRDDVATAVEAMLALIDERSVDLRRLRDEGADVELSVFGYVGDDSTLAFTAGQVARLARAGVRLQLTASVSER